MPKIRCPHCEADLQVDAESEEQRVECPECEGTFVAKFPAKRSSRRVADEDEDHPKKRSSRHRDDDDDDEDFDRRPLKKKTKASGVAIAAMICGIVGLVIEVPAFGTSVFGVACCCFSFLSWPFHMLGGFLGIVGAIQGIFSVKKPKSKGMAITGIATGGLALILAIVGILLNVLGIVMFGAQGAAMPTFAPPPQQVFPQPKPFPQPKLNPLPKPGRNL